MTRGLRRSVVLAAMVACGSPLSSALAQQREPAGQAASKSGPPVLPLLRDLVPPEYRASMPLPFGVSVGGLWMSQVLPLGETELSINGVALPTSLLGTASVKTASNAQGLRADAWLFPFLNVYVMAGRIGGEVSDISIPLNGPPSPALVLPLTVEYKGSLYGFGLTPAIGYKGAFATYDLNWSWATTDVQDSSVEVFNHGPRVGASFGDGGLQGAIYVGAMHQRLSARQRGTIVLLGGVELDYEAFARPDSAWSMLAGGVIVISRHLTIDVEQGFGKRTHTIVALGGRF